MLVSIVNESESGPIRLTINHELPPCGEIEQGAVVDLPEVFYIAATHASCLKVTLHDAAPVAPVAASAVSADIPTESDHTDKE